jgi:hypothetical protein
VSTCKGCGDMKNCPISNKRKLKCPCTICLIKSICQTPCEDYSNNTYKSTNSKGIEIINERLQRM